MQGQLIPEHGKKDSISSSLPIQLNVSRNLPWVTPESAQQKFRLQVCKILPSATSIDMNA
ncbi:MAG: hypothetical protein ACF8OB_17145 [Phycisphaeraceae bacterium JB051]